MRVARALAFLWAMQAAVVLAEPGPPPDPQNGDGYDGRPRRRWTTGDGLLLVPRVVLLPVRLVWKGISYPVVWYANADEKYHLTDRFWALLTSDDGQIGIRPEFSFISGYKPNFGGVTYPGLGSTVSAELSRDDSPLPNFVVTGTPLNTYDYVGDPGYRGPRHAPLALPDAGKGLDNLKPAVADDEFRDRTDVLDKLEQSFARTYKSPAAEAHQTTLARALRLMRSDKGKAFDLSPEPAKVREAYGDNYFGRDCLLARRLVEAGVPFVEVYLSSWDGHSKQEADRAKALQPLLDAGMASLLTDLKERGLLETTLVIWMGEFGRTPRVNPGGGRDHYAKAWSTVLAGGGVKGGQVIGATDANAAEVKERPVSVRDFMATVCALLGIDPAKKIDTPVGRPIQIVDKGGAPIKELLG